MQASRLRRTVGALMVAGIVVAACGSSDGGSDNTSAPDTGGTGTEAPAGSEAPAGTDTAPAGTEGGGTGEALPTEGQVEVAAGTTLDLDACPDEWSATEGADGDEIHIGQTLPTSGQLAGFGAIGEGIQMYFDYLNDNDPIDGKKLTLTMKDDGYETGRAVANVEEMLDTDDIFIFAHFIGTPINAATRDITAKACVPQLFNSSGFPDWGDPAHYPWNTGFILDYSTEANIWCTDIVNTLGEGATVAGLFMNNDFGQTYEKTVKKCADDGKIDLVAEQLHDPAAPDITNEMTTLSASDADVFIAGTTAAFCPQTVASVAATEWRPRYYMSYTCNNLASFIEPVKDQAGQLADEGSGVLMTNSNKVCGDPQWADDPSVQQTQQILKDYGNGVTCADGSYSTGILYGEAVEAVLRQAAAMPGGLNRVNIMASAWNADWSNGNLLGGQWETDGVNDAYYTEAAQVQMITVNDGKLGFEAQGDVIDMEGEGGSFDG